MLPSQGYPMFLELLSLNMPAHGKMWFVNSKLTVLAVEVNGIESSGLAIGTTPRFDRFLEGFEGLSRMQRMAAVDVSTIAIKKLTCN